MLACPFGIPRYEWERTRPFIRKCTMCNDRMAKGEKPSCVAACPHDAMLFGDRGDMLAEAHWRIRSDPDIYLDHVYGEEEVGGTCVLYVSHTPLDAMGWPKTVGSKALPEFTWPVISKTPAIAISVAGCLSAVTWIVQRRMQIAQEQTAREVGCPRQEAQS
jgi:formate dehydrogenase iron-sulfur subunit